MRPVKSFNSSYSSTAVRMLSSRLSRNILTWSTNNFSNGAYLRSFSNTRGPGNNKAYMQLPVASDITSSSMLETSTVNTVTSDEASLKIASTSLKDYSPNFMNAELIAQQKSTTDLLRSLLILRFCSSEWLVKRSQSIMQLLRKIVGPGIWNSLLRPTIYDQFVGGDSPAQLKSRVTNLLAGNLLPMIMVSIEEPQASLSSREELDQLYERNFNKLRNCIDQTRDFCIERPMMQVKWSALLPHTLLEKLSQAWLTETEGNPTRIPEKLVDDIANFMKTGHLSDSLIGILNDDEKKKSDLHRFKTSLKYIEKIGEHAATNGLTLLVDAEYTNINRGLTSVAIALSLLHNTPNHAVIWNTHQGYLKQSADQVNAELAFLHNRGVSFGCKLVRGAYMIWERNNALKTEAASPVFDSYEETNTNYDTIASFLLDKIDSTPSGVTTNVILATHNEDSLRKAIYRKMMSSSPNEMQKRVVFGQIFGMGDNISYTLANIAEGSSVYKSVPYGSLEETLPYLARRAMDNCSIFLRVRQEREVLWRAYQIKVFRFWKSP